MYVVNGTLVNIMNEVWGIALTIAGLAIIFVYRNNQIEYMRIYFRDVKMMFVWNLLSMTADLIGSIFNGSTNAYAGVIERIANFVLYVSNDLLIFSLCFYVIHCVRTGKAERAEKIYSKIVWGVLFFNFGLLLISQFNGMLYYISSSNYYCRGTLFALNQGTGIVLEFLNLLLVALFGREMDKYLRITIYVYSIIPAIAVIGGLFFDGVVLLFIATSFSLLIFLIGLCFYNSRLIHEQEQKILNQSMNAMISQIQPHFLYNSISAIMGIEGNPPETKKALSNFGKYLRGNLDVLKTNAPIPFTKELEHVKAYVNLEKVRFEDRLEVVYDIEEKNFLIPALTVQMMVENAIKHGITKKKGKGTVTITSRTVLNGLEEMAVITVTDDGVGFDPKEKPSEERSHVGLENTKERLIHMVNGTMEIESVIGEGTKVTITIPK